MNHQQPPQTPKKKAEVIPFRVKTEEEKKAEAMRITFDQCSFCGEFPPKGQYIKSDTRDKNVQDQDKFACICFKCIGEANERLTTGTPND